MRTNLLLLVLFVSGQAFGAVIKNDTFTVGADTALESHTSDSGGGWQGGDANDVDVIASTDSVAGDGAPTTLTPVGDEGPAATDYFVEIAGTLGGTADTDRIGVLARGQHGAAGAFSNSSSYQCDMRGDDGWRLFRIVSGATTLLDFDTGYVATNSIGISTEVKIKIEVSGTGATVNIKCSIDPDGGGYTEVTDPGGFDDTNAARIVTAGNVGLYLAGTNARITSINAEDATSASTSAVMRRRRSQ